MVPAAIVVLPRVPLTAHGKLDRSALPAPEFLPVAWRAPRTPDERVVCALFADLLGVTGVGLDDDFFALGGDSIQSIQLVSRAREAGLAITARDVFEHATVERLAAAARPVTPRTADAHADADVADGPVPLMPIVCWLAERGGPIRRFSQSAVTPTPAGLDEEGVTAVLQALLDHHHALRLRLSRAPDAGPWSLAIEPAGRVAASSCLQRVRPDSLGDALSSQVRALTHAAIARLDPEAGVMVQAVWFDGGRHVGGRLFLAVHHLAIDGVSWRILLDDLGAALEAVSAAQPLTLRRTGTSLRRWASHLQTEALRPGRVAELPFWRDTLHGRADLAPMASLDPTRHTMGSASRLTLTLPAAVTTAVLTSVPAAFHANVNDVLLAALAIGASRWRSDRGDRGTAATLVDVEGHGRDAAVDGIDPSATVGWLTTIHPVRLDPGDIDLQEAWAGGPALGHAVKRIKEQLRAAPDGGLGYGLLRYLNQETAGELARFPAPQLGFNYLGRVAGDGPAAPSTSGAALDGFDPDLPLAHLVEVNAIARERPGGAELIANWTWASDQLSAEDVQALGQRWFDALERLVRYASQPGAGGRTPSDLPLVSLTQDEIELLERAYAPSPPLHDPPE